MSGPGLGWPVNDRQPVPADGGWSGGPYRPATMRARAAMILLGIHLVLSIAVAGWAVMGFDIIERGFAGRLSTEEGAAYDSTTALLNGLEVIVYVLTAIAFLAWLSRTVDNVPKVGEGRTSKGPRAAIGWWFVPFANYVVPYTIVKDTVEQLRADPIGRIEGLLLPWWLTYIFGNIISLLATRITDPTMENLQLVLTLTVVAEGLLAVAAVLLILIIRGTEERVTARAAATSAAARAAWEASTAAGTGMAGTPGTVDTADARVREVLVVDASGPASPPPPPAAG